MPIRINLLAEAQAAEEQRRKDPVKRAYYAAGFVVFLVALWGTTLQLKLMARGNESAGLETQWKSIETDYQSVVARKRDAIEAEQRLAALDQLRTNRFLWGTALNALQQSIAGIDGIQVIRLSTENNYQTLEESRGTGPDGKPLKTLRAIEQIAMTIEANDFSSQPGNMVNKYKESIGKVPFFAENLQKTNGVRLMTLSPPQLGAKYPNPFVRFSLECSFPEIVR